MAIINSRSCDHQAGPQCLAQLWQNHNPWELVRQDSRTLGKMVSSQQTLIGHISFFFFMNLILYLRRCSIQSRKKIVHPCATQGYAMEFKFVFVKDEENKIYIGLIRPIQKDIYRHLYKISRPMLHP